MKYLLVLVVLISSYSHGWVQTGNTTIKEMVLWESGIKHAVVKMENDIICYLPLTDKELYSAILAFYLSGKTINLHCYDEAVNVAGYMAHRIHRLNAVH